MFAHSSNHSNHEHCLCSHFSFSYSQHKQLNGDLKGITLVMFAVREQVALMSSATICSWTVCHVAALICVPLLHLKVKDFWYVIFQHSDILHTLSVFSYIFLLQPPEITEWRRERYHSSDPCCSWTSSTNELLLEQHVSATICSWRYIYIYIFFEAVIVIMCNYFPKLLKAHFFILHIFRSRFGSFFCASNFTILSSNILQHSP